MTGEGYSIADSYIVLNHGSLWMHIIHIDMHPDKYIPADLKTSQPISHDPQPIERDKREDGSA